MPRFNISPEAYEAANEEEVPRKPEMTNPELDEAIKAVMSSERNLMAPEAQGVKEKNVKLAQKESKGLIGAIKTNPTIGRIVSSPLFAPAIGFTVAIISNEISGWAHAQGEATLAQVYNPFFDKMSSNPSSWWDYFTASDLAHDAADYAAIMRGAQLVSIASAGAGIVKLGVSAREWIAQRTKKSQGESLEIE